MKKDQSRLLGLSILVSFISYAGGSTLLATPHLEMLGGFAVVIIHTVSNFVWIACMYRWLLPLKDTGATVYSLLGCFATIILAIGGIVLATTVLSEHLQAFGIRLSFLCYQSGMFLWGIAGCIACWILMKHAFVPKPWFRFGFIAYFIFTFGCMLEWFGYSYGLYCSIPGALFEFGLASWALYGLPDQKKHHH